MTYSAGGYQQHRMNEWREGGRGGEGLKDMGFKLETYPKADIPGFKRCTFYKGYYAVTIFRTACILIFVSYMASSFL